MTTFANMAKGDEDTLKSLLNEYNQFTSQCSNKLISSAKDKQKAIEEIRRDGEETLKSLDILLNHLKQYSSTTQTATSFKGLKDEVSKIVREKQASLDRAIELKSDKKAAIASINKETEQMNDDIQRLTDDNERITKILKSETDNLVCRLMKGSG